MNPLGEINRNWNEAAMNASMESIMGGYGDPRLGKFFEPCKSDLVIPDESGELVTVALKGDFRGIRQGTCFSHNYYAAFSRLAIETTTDAVLMTAAEVWFLRAEAALRGWTDEDAETCYRNGVTMSFAQWQAPGMKNTLRAMRWRPITATPWLRKTTLPRGVVCRPAGTRRRAPS